MLEENERQKQTLLNGRYRITKKLTSRPHLTLYLGRRVSQRAIGESQSHNAKLAVQQEPLVAIRELVLSDFSPMIRAQIEAAAVEEFAAPAVFSSSHLPNTGDRIWREDDRIYLVLQLNTPYAASISSTLHTSSSTISEAFSEPVTLDRLLLDSSAWPKWLDMRTALEWGIQLCRMVARLHHQGVVLGNLNPCTILVYAREEMSEHEQAMWSPLLLPCWPPAPCYWQGGSGKSHTYQMFAAHDYATAFPIGRNGREDAFTSPEMLYESRNEVTERADIYSLGAILYLLLTHYAPICAATRAVSEQYNSSSTFDTPRGGMLYQPLTYSISTPAVHLGGTRTRFERRRQTHHSRLSRGASSIYNLYEEQASEEQGLELLDPRMLNSNVSIELAEIVMRALELEPDKRFPSVFTMVEALEAMN